MTRDEFFQQAMLKMAEVILLRTDKEPTPEQLAKKASSYAEALHNEMLAGLTRCDILEMTSGVVQRDTKPENPASDIPTLGPARPSAPGPVCPECGGPTRHRNGQYGPFWGCAAFPRCKGIVKQNGA